ncbi:hypothetical protein SLEP1_g48936 [Rubroshorea leprosula]|uniref:DUF4283 domain-containing protein n=1 Tax=Rubroshorea leprosula TaxID=152421 RepID=A0AAV5LX59_9ROSI|nr:hypothetical protein SLEP1_g48936 [Rubroshorea leprosula]
MELNLCKIKVGDRSLQANLAMYNEENGELGMKKRESKSNAGPSKRVEATVGTKSYADVVRSNEGLSKEKGVQGKRWTPKKNSRWNEEMGEPVEIWECQPSAENEEWLKNCFVGQIQRIEMITELKDKIMIEGFFSINITPMGGNLVLMHSEVEGEITKLVKEGSGWIGEWLSDIRPWSLKEVAKERYTWLQCYSIPLNVWNEEFFIKFGNRYGKAVEVDQLTTLKKRLDVGRVRISTTTPENISKSLKIKVNEVLFQVRICEETGRENVYSPYMSLEEEGESSEALWVEESSLGESDSEWEDRELIEDSLQFSTRKARMEGDNQPVEEGGCTPAGNFESPLEEARKAKVIDGTDGEAGSDGEAKTAGSCHTRKEYSCSNGYIEEVESPREQSTNEEKKDIQISVGAKEQKANRNTKESESDEVERNEDARDDAIKFWEGLASEEELAQLRKKGKQQRKLRKSKGDQKKKEERKKKQVAAGGMEVSIEKSKERDDQTENTTEVSQKGISISVSDINNCNRRFMLRSWEEEASELWAVGKKLGLVRRGNKEEIIKRLGEMEKRDRLALAEKNRKAGVDREGQELLR